METATFHYSDLREFMVQTIKNIQYLLQ